MTGECLYILAPFVPTPGDVVDRMLALAEVTSEDLVYDLGCGDGRIIIAAAKQCGARGLGVDIEPYWVETSRANAKQAGVDHLVTFKVRDALKLDLSPATVVMLYLVEWSTAKFQPLITSMVKPGTRIVSHSFSMDNWAPVKVEKFVDANGDARTLYLWIAE
jgi:cyclopropane fatty-acyl-phospholipid synthase-like methyltransferase